VLYDQAEGLVVFLGESRLSLDVCDKQMNAGLNLAWGELRRGYEHG